MIITLSIEYVVLVASHVTDALLPYKIGTILLYLLRGS